VRGSDAQGSGIYIGSLDTGVSKRMPLGLAKNAAYASDRLLYVLGRSLMAHPFDPDRLETIGPAVALADGVEPDLGGRPEFSVSQNGVLVFQSEADAPSRLEWFDASGKALGALPGFGFKYPRFSPDGRLLAVSSDDARDGKYCIRVYDLTRGINTRLTSGGTDLCPVWTKDGMQITASTDGNNL
jgi:WD40-like Beta Propeller Repeat